MDGSLRDITTYQAGITQSTAHRLLKKFTDDCLAPYGLTTMQWFIIGAIYDAGDNGIGMTDLSRVVDTNVPYITNTLNRLEDKGMVARGVSYKKDRRSKVVRIHPQFQSSVQDIEEDLRDQMRDTIYAYITPEEFRTYIRVLMKLSQTLED